MRYLAVFFLLTVVCAYNDVDNNINYEDVAKNATELRHHLYCFLDKEPCSDVAAHYKSHILEALINDCAYCTDRHKHNAKWFIRGVKEKFPTGYLQMKQKYDPQDKFFKILEPNVDKF